MKTLYYKPEGAWLGDVMPFARDGQFYLYYLKDTRNSAVMGEPFGWHLVTTHDFVNFNDQGTAVPNGDDNEQDQYIFSGSVFEDKDGSFHAFYTGHNFNFLKENKRPAEAIMHASSGDLLRWEKTGRLLLTFQEGYEKHDWRDPFVIWDAESERYLMLIGARKTDGEKKLTGCTVYYESKNLKAWTFKEAFCAPHCFTMHEMPDLFKIGEWWYLIISEYSDRNRTIYRMSRSLKGPWFAPEDDSFDGRAYYAARTCAYRDRRYLFGWVPTRKGREDGGQYEWGGHMSVHEVVQRTDGTLGVKALDSLWNAFGKGESLAPVVLRSVDAVEQSAPVRDMGNLFRLEADIVFEEGTRWFALKLYENEKTGEAYQFKFNVSENRFYFEYTPNWPWTPCWMGLDRILPLTPGKTYKLRLIVDDTIATIYANDTALSARMYRRPGENLSFILNQGKISINNFGISRGLVRNVSK